MCSRDYGVCDGSGGAPAHAEPQWQVHRLEEFLRVRDLHWMLPSTAETLRSGRMDGKNFMGESANMQEGEIEWAWGN